MSSKAIQGATSAVLPYVALAGGALLLVKSGLLGKFWDQLTGSVTKTGEQMYNNIYNSRTMETVRNVTNLEFLTDRKYVDVPYSDATVNDQPVDWNKVAPAVTTEGRTLLPVTIPGNDTGKDYMITVLGPAVSGTPTQFKFEGKPTAALGVEEVKPWWRKNAFDVAGDVWGFLTGNQKTEHVSAPNLHTQSTGISVISPSQYYGGSSMEQIEQTISKNPAVNPAVAERVSRDEERNRQARSDNARRLAEAEANPPTLEQILNDPSVWPTPSQSTKPNYGF